MMRPPAVITGVATGDVATQPLDFPRNEDFRLSLDYLTARVDAPWREVSEKLSKELGASCLLGRAKNGYTHSVDLAIGEDVFASVHASPTSENMREPCVIVPGNVSATVERALRKCNFKYRVSRKDAALDMYDAEYFPVLVSVLKKHASLHEPKPLKTACAGDWLHPVKGRTFYVGARTSRVMFRLYEWGRCHGEDPNWIRFEVEYKPQEDAERYAAADMTAADIFAAFGVPAVGQALCISADDVPQIPSAPPRVRRDVVRARNALAHQYGKTVESWLRDCGGDPAAFVSDVLEAIERVRERANRPDAPRVLMPELSP